MDKEKESEDLLFGAKSVTPDGGSGGRRQPFKVGPYDAEDFGQDAEVKLRQKARNDPSLRSKIEKMSARERALFKRTAAYRESIDGFRKEQLRRRATAEYVAVETRAFPPRELAERMTREQAAKLIGTLQSRLRLPGKTVLAVALSGLEPYEWARRNGVKPRTFRARWKEGRVALARAIRGLPDASGGKGEGRLAFAEAVLVMWGGE